MECLWSSRNCTGELDHYRVVITGQEEVHPLCAFHGKAWPRVGETPEESERRTHGTRLALTNRARTSGVRESSQRGRRESTKTRAVREARERETADVAPKKKEVPQ